MSADKTKDHKTNSLPAWLIVMALISLIVLILTVIGAIRAAGRVRAEREALAARCTGITTGHKENQESYTKFWFDFDDQHSEVRYRTTFSYAVDGETLNTETDSGIEKLNEEDVHYDPDDPSVCYVDLYSAVDDSSVWHFITGIILSGCMLAASAAGGIGMLTSNGFVA